MVAEEADADRDGAPEGTGPADTETSPGPDRAETAEAAPDPGWYPDPAGHAQERWWDGSRWTQGTRDGNRPGATTTAEDPSRQVTEPDAVTTLVSDDVATEVKQTPAAPADAAQNPSRPASTRDGPTLVRTPALSFFEAVDRAVRRAFDVHGRSRRSEFWWFVVLQGVFLLIASAAGPTALIVVSAIIIVPYTTLAIRRMHDTGRSGAWVFWLLYAPQLPQLLGLLLLSQGSLGAWLTLTTISTFVAFPCVVIAIVLFAMPGDATPNAYGPPTAHTSVPLRHA